MPEYPEILQLSRQMNSFLKGRTIIGMELRQEKCLNLPSIEFREKLLGAKILEVSARGKWIFTQTTQGWLLINLGMGGEILMARRAFLPDKWRLIFDLDNISCLTVNFWWFGYAHYVAEGDLASHSMTARLGPNVLDIDPETFSQLFADQRKQIKTLLLDQAFVAGIGNSYVHDILFLAKLHPFRQANSLRLDEKSSLHNAIHTVLEASLAKGGAAYEMDLFGNKGGYDLADSLIGYKEGQSCPSCGTLIEKIKTGSTSSFICPNCQAAAITT